MSRKFKKRNSFNKGSKLYFDNKFKYLTNENAFDNFVTKAKPNRKIWVGIMPILQ